MTPSGGNRLLNFTSDGNLMADDPKVPGPEDPRLPVPEDPKVLAPGEPKVPLLEAPKVLLLDPGKGDRKELNWLLEVEGLEGEEPLAPPPKNELEAPLKRVAPGPLDGSRNPPP